MTTTRLPRDFKEFLKLLNEHEVKYLLVGGYAVAYYGYPRTTAEIDVWVPTEPKNAKRLVAALKAFGFDVPDLSPEMFLSPDRIVRMGVADVHRPPRARRRSDDHRHRRFGHGPPVCGEVEARICGTVVPLSW